MIVTIDGPAGVGKTTLARALAQHKGFFLLPSGAVYRALTYAALKQRHIALDGQPHTQDFRWLPEIKLELEGKNVLLDGQETSEQLHTPEVSRAVAALSTFHQVRGWVNQKLRDLARRHPLVVAEGRDMGSEVFPTAELKIFLQAPLSVRIARCVTRGQTLDIQEDLSTRDQLDYQKQYGRLRVADGAHVFDVSSLTFKQVYDRLVDLLESATVTRQDGRRQKTESP